MTITISYTKNLTDPTSTMGGLASRNADLNTQLALCQS
jgi:hypothetical protein